MKHVAASKFMPEFMVLICMCCLLDLSPATAEGVQHTAEGTTCQIFSAKETLYAVCLPLSSSPASNISCDTIDGIDCSTHTFHTSNNCLQNQSAENPIDRVLSLLHGSTKSIQVIDIQVYRESCECTVPVPQSMGHLHNLLVVRSCLLDDGGVDVRVSPGRNTKGSLSITIMSTTSMDWRNLKVFVWKASSNYSYWGKGCTYNASAFPTNNLEMRLLEGRIRCSDSVEIRRNLIVIAVVLIFVMCVWIIGRQCSRLVTARISRKKKRADVLDIPVCPYTDRFNGPSAEVHHHHCHHHNDHILHAPITCSGNLQATGSIIQSEINVILVYHKIDTYVIDNHITESFRGLGITAIHQTPETREAWVNILHDFTAKQHLKYMYVVVITPAYVQNINGILAENIWDEAMRKDTVSLHLSQRAVPIFIGDTVDEIDMHDSLRIFRPVMLKLNLQRCSRYRFNPTRLFRNILNQNNERYVL